MFGTTDVSIRYFDYKPALETPAQAPDYITDGGTQCKPLSSL